MEAVAIVTLMLLLLRMTRRRWRRTEVPPMASPPEPGGDLAGDRSPRRPRVPSLSGAAALPIPHDS